MKVTFQNLSKKYHGKYALDHFTATIEDGVYGLLGENGAGKTTLLNLFMGVLRPDGGEIFVDGVNVRELGASFLDNIGYLPQFPVFYRDFSVEEFLRYMSVLKHMPKRVAEERIEELLEAVHLKEARKKKIGALSGGMRQRLGIAQAVLADPGILILDEPTAGLDPGERIRFRNLISRFSQGRIVILATHIVPDVEFIANQIILLKKGRLVCLGNPEDLTGQLEGKVWEVKLSQPSMSEELFRGRISNLTRTESDVRLRMLSENSPCPDAAPVKANLEEVFLYYCGEEQV